ncbi:MAG: hypothetical protein SXQ77_12295, partial [Halobacteria archaeon]|nr:hypothetical protein [Halobacteria archaeon]
MTEEIKIRSEDDSTEISETENLVSEVMDLFGKTVLTTEIEDKNRVRVNGNDWQVRMSADGELVFKPGGAALRFVRYADELVEVEQEPESVSFFFGDEV